MKYNKISNDSCSVRWVIALKEEAETILVHYKMKLISNKTLYPIFKNNEGTTMQKGMIEINPSGRNFNEMFICQCDYFKNEKKFCSHLIPILNEFGIRHNCFSEREWKDEENVLWWMLNKIKS